VFGREKHTVPLDRIEVTLGPTTNVNGDLECDGIVRIEGVYQGSIKTVSNVIVSENARVDAHIEAQNVSVSGQVKGSIVAKGRLEILSTGKVWADCTVSSFLLDDGGKLHGGLEMFGAGPAPASFQIPPKAQSAAKAGEAAPAEDLEKELSGTDDDEEEAVEEE
jgi:cytoskeletal protein CcmA (bactofilin family)